jgi:hypothetical protein
MLNRRRFLLSTAAGATTLARVTAAKPQFKPANELLRDKTFGISEWQNHYRGDEPNIGTPAIIDQCVEAHRNAGLHGIVWNAGRATVLYHSDLPHTTRQFELGFVPKPQRVSCQYVRDVLKQCCPLRRAIRLGHASGMPILGRLSMNRFYGTPRNVDSTSRFYQRHPDWVETGRLGQRILHKMCYAIPGVQQERMDILLEIQRIGVDALLLDFCRQMPILAYHRSVVDPFIERHGQDPRKIRSARPDDYAKWFRYRAGILTGFMRRLRAAVRRQEAELKRPCPIVIRVPDYTAWLMVACGLDVETWFADDLIDATMLSPFPRIKDDLKSYPDEHVRLAERHGKLCLGGVGSKGLQHKGQRPLHAEEAATNVKFAYRVAALQHGAGVHGMSLYQSESLCRKPYLSDLVRNLGNRDWLERAVAGVPETTPDDFEFLIGKDWHSTAGSEGLDVSEFGNNAL